MTDTLTRTPLMLWTLGGMGPTLFVARAQMEEVSRHLRDHGIPHEVDSIYVSMNGGPEKGAIRFGKKADAAAVQAILDLMP